MQMKITILGIVLSNVLGSLTSWAAMEACGTVSFEPLMSCDATSVSFNISTCDQAYPEPIKATKVSCEGAEMIALLTVGKDNYRAVFQKGYNGEWQQKGQVWKAVKEGKAVAAAKSPTPVAKKNICF